MQRVQSDRPRRSNRRAPFRSACAVAAIAGVTAAGLLAGPPASAQPAPGVLERQNQIERQQAERLRLEQE